MQGDIVVKVIALFGPTSSAEIDLYGQGTKIIPEMDCLCCYLPRCDVRPCCMERIAPERVYAAIRDLLSREPR